MNIPVNLFPNGLVGLDAKALTPEQKHWLGDYINARQDNANNLGKLCGVKSRTLYKYANVSRTHIELKAGPGQPKHFDDEDVADLKEAALEGGTCKNIAFLQAKFDEILTDRARNGKIRLPKRSVKSSQKDSSTKY